MSVLRAAMLLAMVATGCCTVTFSTSPPGGLSPDQVPMFVLFSHDDAVRSDSYNAVRSIADGRTVNGCPVTATMFTKVEGTDCEDLVDLYNAGYEIADHSISHDSFLDMDNETLYDEIVGARQQLAECGVPESSIVGMRTPFLRINSEVRQILQDNGFLYDSTMRALSESMSERAWPWDMADGIPNCRESNPMQQCAKNETWPGLWNVPVWILAAQGSEYHMNYADDGAVPVYDFLKEVFDASYNANRAPMPLFVHTPWIEEFDTGLRQFMDYAGSLPDVYFVTVRQLIAWMQNPVPKDRLTPQMLGCGNEGGAGPAGPVETFTSAGDGGMQAPALASMFAPTPAPAPAPGPWMAEEGSGDDEEEQDKEDTGDEEREG